MIAVLAATQLADLGTYLLIVATGVAGTELSPLAALPLPALVAAKLVAAAVIVFGAYVLRRRRNVVALLCVLSAVGLAANVAALT